MKPKLLHRSKYYFIKEYNVNSNSCLVCFTPWISTVPRDELNAAGFGERVFINNNINELHIIARDNRWYQDSLLLDFLKEYKSKNTNTKFTCYGSSMGAYGALVYSNILDADCISISPQFSIDREVVPFEKRWEKESKIINFNLNIEYNDNPGLLIYDHASLDHKHGNLIREKRPNYQVFSKSFLGHPAGAFVNSFYGLKKLVVSYVNGQFSLEEFENQYSSKKRQSHWYWNNMAYQLLKFGKLNIANHYRAEFQSIYEQHGKKVYFVQKLLKKI